MHSFSLCVYLRSARSPSSVAIQHGGPELSKVDGSPNNVVKSSLSFRTRARFSRCRKKPHPHPQRHSDCIGEVGRVHTRPLPEDGNDASHTYHSPAPFVYKLKGIIFEGSFFPCDDSFLPTRVEGLFACYMTGRGPSNRPYRLFLGFLTPSE